MASKPTEETCELFCFNEALVRKLKQGLPDDEELDSAQALFSAFGSTTRLRILSCLMQADELCVCDIANALDTNLSTVSHQLRYLRNAGMVAFRSAGKMAFYRLADPVVPRLLGEALVRKQRLVAR